MSSLPVLSVVIPTYNRARSLERVLAGLAQQDLAPDQFEVVVVSDGSTDQTQQLLKDWPTPFRLVPVIQPNQGPAAARNRGVAEAVGALIVFLDDDVAPAANFLSEHLKAQAAHGPHTVVIGPMLPPPDQRLAPWVRWSQARLAEQYQDMQTGKWQATARQFYTGNASVARSHLLTSGGFDARFKRAEDVELAYRLADAGLQFVFWPAAVGYHYEARSFAAWLDIPYAYGRSDVTFTYDKGQSWLLPRIMKEWGERRWPVRAAVYLCLDRPRQRQWITATMHQFAQWGDRLNAPLLSRLACSILFNLYHYQGIADGLGGRAQFFALAVAQAAGQTTPVKTSLPSAAHE